MWNLVVPVNGASCEGHALAPGHLHTYICVCVCVCVCMYMHVRVSVFAIQGQLSG